jgi:hypothetical protein
MKQKYLETLERDGKGFNIIVFDKYDISML